MTNLDSWSPTRKVLERVHDERLAQDRKWGEQNHPDGSGRWNRSKAAFYRATCDMKAQHGSVTWSDILLEEVFEALAEDDPDNLTTELTQVAAVCVAWIEAIKRREREN